MLSINWHKVATFIEKPTANNDITKSIHCCHQTSITARQASTAYHLISLTLADNSIYMTLVQASLEQVTYLPQSWLTWGTGAVETNPQHHHTHCVHLLFKYHLKYETLKSPVQKYAKMPHNWLGRRHQSRINHSVIYAMAQGPPL